MDELTDWASEVRRIVAVKPCLHCLHVDNVEFQALTDAFLSACQPVFSCQKRPLSTGRNKWNWYNFGEDSTVYILHVAVLLIVDTIWGRIRLQVERS
jgi:hypothetical protein